MGVLADLSGNSGDPLPDLAERKFLQIDIDNFEGRLLQTLNPRLTFRVPDVATDEGELSIDLTFSRMDDFSPGAIARQVLATESPASAEHLSTLINSILHHEDFQRLEGAWRGRYYLVNNTATDEMLKIRVMNVSKRDLSKTLRKCRGAGWGHSPMFRHIYEAEYGAFGGEPYGCLVGDYYFDHGPRDVELLGEMAKICAAAHVPFIAGASPAVVMMDSWQELGKPSDLAKRFISADYAGWRSLRASDDARYIGLTPPRIIARLPYGAAANPVEGIDFAEDIGDGGTDSFTWANSAYAMAVNINRAFERYRWCSRIQGFEAGGAVEGLPVYSFTRDDGGADMKCPTEVTINDRREMELAKNGFPPLAHRKGTDLASFIGAQPLQDPPVYDSPESTANAVLAARFPYLFACCRFVHYLKCIVRDRIGSYQDREDMERQLNRWIMSYLDGHPEASSELEKSHRPLASAQVVVEETEGNSGYYVGKFYLRPHYQLEGLTVSLRLISKLPSIKS
jgi:type VI secretion system protein ImpC